MRMKFLAQNVHF